jgi:hypothetical protein
MVPRAVLRITADAGEYDVDLALRLMHPGYVVVPDQD